jgi:predicted dehydrogenase
MTANNSKLKWGIIGLGKIAHKFASDLQLAKNSELVAVASRSKVKAEEFAETYNAKYAFGSYRELANLAEIDIVYIATPHVFHFEHTMLCLEHKKHVLCEKPMGMNAEQVRAMIAKAREKQLFLMEGLWTSFIPATKKVLDLLDENAIGDIVLLEADFGFKPPFDPEKRIYNKSLGGGSLLDIGIYPVYLSLLLLGMPESIQATASFSTSGVDTFCGILFKHTNGANSVLHSTILTQTPTEAIIYGTKGSIKLHTPFHHSQLITLTQDGKEDVHFELPIIGEGYAHEIQEVEKCLRNKQLESKKYPQKSSLQLIETLDLIRRQIGFEYGTGS